jgi:hypothetical protein
VKVLREMFPKNEEDEHWGEREAFLRSACDLILHDQIEEVKVDLNGSNAATRTTLPLRKSSCRMHWLKLVSLQTTVGRRLWGSRMRLM